MLEIILLIFLTKKIGIIAQAKGLPANRWKLYLVLGWIFAELIGAFIAVIIFGPENLISCFLIAIGCAGTSYISIKNYLSRLPDVLSDDEVNNFGR